MEPVRPAETEVLPNDSSLIPMACDGELTSVSTAEDDEQLVDYNSLISSSSSTPIACDDELTSVPSIEDDELLVDYSSSPEQMIMFLM